MNNAQKFIEQNMQSKGNYAAIQYDRWDGFINELDVIDEMHNQGWRLIDSHFSYEPEVMKGECVADNTFGELIFERMR